MTTGGGEETRYEDGVGIIQVSGVAFCTRGATAMVAVNADKSAPKGPICMRNDYVASVEAMYTSGGRGGG